MKGNIAYGQIKVTLTKGKESVTKILDRFVFTMKGDQYYQTPTSDERIKKYLEKRYADYKVQRVDVMFYDIVGQTNYEI